ncbi:MAG: amidohydrolase family protein [Acidimicrobiales bacterium]|nr:amidohydrolase family protein [Acidimicrobiales bacterium]MDG1878011.1 amidohydrolase family protein [Acidimicrobiales bacterium]
MQLIRGTVVAMDTERRILDNAAIAVDGSTIAAVGPFEELRHAHPGAPVSGRASDLVLPGYINGHQHLTGDRLIQSSIPDDLPPGEAIFSWVVPIHAVHTPDDDELSASLTLAESLTNGITTTFEAGTVAYPDRVATAAEKTGARLTVGTWGWDIDEGPYTATTAEVLDRQRQNLDLTTGDRVSKWVSLVGHDLMSDELVVGAAELAQERQTGLTFHLSPTASDPESYLVRTGKRPVVHLHELGVLGPNLAIAHGVHLDNQEVELLVETQTAVVSCPWAYLRLGQGISQEFRHRQLWQQGGRIALGCDSENAGDMVDGIRTAALFAGLAKDQAIDPTVFNAQHALELLTIRGAEALGVADRIGSLEPGKEADIVVHDRTHTEWIPPSSDPVLQLVWGSDGRSVRDVWVAGQQVVRDEVLVTFDVAAATAEAKAAAVRLRRDARI